jgi:hypothetical protein
MQDKQDKQKVTLYLPPELHRQLKIKAAIEADNMSTLAERAITFYLNHSEVVDRHDGYGQTHRVYGCPDCATALVMVDDELVALKHQSAIVADDVLTESLRSAVSEFDPEAFEPDALVPC